MHYLLKSTYFAVTATGVPTISVQNPLQEFVRLCKIVLSAGSCCTWIFWMILEVVSQAKHTVLPTDAIQMLTSHIRNDKFAGVEWCSTLLSMCLRKQSCDIKFRSNSHRICIRRKYEPLSVVRLQINAVAGCMRVSLGDIDLFYSRYIADNISRYSI